MNWLLVPSYSRELCAGPRIRLSTIGATLQPFAGAAAITRAPVSPANPHPATWNARLGERVEILPAAVWPGGETAPCLAPPANPYDTCQFSMVFQEGGTPVPTATLEEVLARAGGQVRLLKLDCEGAEYAILDSAKLDVIVELCGEAHDFEHKGLNQDSFKLVSNCARWGPTHFHNNGPTTYLWWSRLD